MILTKLAVVITLAYASFEDFRNWKVHDKVFLIGFGLALLFGAVSEGLIFMGSMILQGLMGGIVGFLLNIVGKFGGADIWAIALACAVFPEILLFKVLAFLLVPMILWVKIYSFLNMFGKKKGGPAIPGIMIGFLVLLSYYGI